MTTRLPNKHCFRDMGEYIKIPRELFEGPEFNGEKFSRREALIDLIQMAVLKHTIVDAPGGEVRIERGQIAASRGFLAARWGWDKSRVRRFLDTQCEKGRCTQDSGRITILTISNFESYYCDPEEKPGPVPKEDKLGAINRLYALYPTKCPVSRRATGKSSKDKHKLEVLLRTNTEEKLAGIIKRYIKECTEQQTYVKNFATFLNNLPDYNQPVASVKETKEEAIRKASHPSQEEIDRQYNSFFLPQYPPNEGETSDEHRKRVQPFWDNFYNSWIIRRVQAVNNSY